MTTVPTKECSHCKSHFEDKTVNQNAKYCSSKCQAAASYQRKKAKHLSGVDDMDQVTNAPAKPIETGLVKRERTQLPAQLDAVSQFLITRLEREIDDLRAEIKKREGQINDYQAKEKEYEKQIVELNNQIGAKPTGLGGFLERNSDLAGKVVEQLGPRFGEGLGKLFEVVSDKLSGPSSPHADVITEWLVKQPANVQDDVVTMLRGLIALGPMGMNEKMAEVTRSLMAKSTTVNEAPKEEKKQLKVMGNR